MYLRLIFSRSGCGCVVASASNRQMASLTGGIDGVLSEFAFLAECSSALGITDPDDARIVQLCLLNRLYRRRTGLIAAGEAEDAVQLPDDLRDPECSLYQIALSRRQDCDYLKAFKLTVDAFDTLFAEFEPLWSPIVRVAGTVGGPRRLDPRTTLAAVLVYLTSLDSVSTMAQCFGCPQSTFSATVQDAMCIVSVACSRLGGEPEWPSETTMAELASRVSAASEVLMYTWGAMDGHMLVTQRSADPSQQEANFSGWKHGHYVSNVYVWGFDGLIRWAGINFPGNTHDAWIARGAMTRLASMPGEYNILGDTAFPSLEGTLQYATVLWRYH